MRRAKNRTKDEPEIKKKSDQRCGICGGSDVAFAGMLVRGRVKFVCHKCYRR